MAKKIETKIEKKNEIEVKDKEFTMMNMLNRIFICLIVIAVVLVANTIVLSYTSYRYIKDQKDNNTSTTSSSDRQEGENSEGAGQEEEELGEYDVSMMTEVDEAGVLDIFKEKGAHVLYVGRPSCGWCVRYLPSLQKAQEEYGYVTYYYNIEKMQSDSTDYKNMVKKLSFKDSDYNETFGNLIGITPMTIIIKDGKQVDGALGAIEYEQLQELLEKNGIKK